MNGVMTGLRSSSSINTWKSERGCVHVCRARCVFVLFSVTYSFILKELSELVSGLVAVGVTLPVIRHVVNVRQDDFKQLLGTEHHMLVWDKRPGADGGSQTTRKVHLTE